MIGVILFALYLAGAIVVSAGSLRIESRRRTKVFDTPAKIAGLFAVCLLWPITVPMSWVIVRLR